MSSRPPTNKDDASDRGVPPHLEVSSAQAAAAPALDMVEIPEVPARSPDRPRPANSPGASQGHTSDRGSGSSIGQSYVLNSHSRI